tara:strand:+ start:102 stop:428 length:327 start_codon:yes stop_codon:yes gene_type:complete
MKTKYQIAKTKHDEAAKAFDLIWDSYRDAKISYEEFSDAKKVYDMETQKFNAAWKKEIRRQERLEARLYEVGNAICHWTSTRDRAEYWLKARLAEKADIENELKLLNA